MGSWRRHRGEIRQQEVKGTRTQSRKPPLDNWRWGVPSWEKKFCSYVGSVSWKKILDTKKCMYLYENVVNWNDSAGEEAFHNAKSRFWAEMNGLPCDISPPDPDIYIDEVDWNSSIDPDLLLDLEREPEAPVDGEDGVVDGLYDILGLNQTFWSTGWGEAEEDFQKSNALFREGNDNYDRNMNDGKNSWEMNYYYAPESQGLREKEYDQYLNNSVGWNSWENHQNEPDKRFSNETWRTWDLNNKKMGGNWCSTFEASRFQNDGYRRENGWRNRRGRW